ncbi:hypothetical protein WM46_06950 [Citrobacter freundii complex sp. CFNIH2]|nr:hypothetical protein WM46_06950 [Citrobacter freundii complex sp. CFNIH2]
MQVAELEFIMAKPNATEGLSASEGLANACNQQDNDGRRTPDSSLLYLSAHNVRLVMLKRPLRKSNPAAASLA